MPVPSNPCTRRTVRLVQTLVSTVNGATPRVAGDAFLARGVVVLGDVEVQAEASVWYGSVLRGDSAPIRVGAQTNLQDGVVVHADHGFPADIGARVSVGHRAVLHGCTVADDVLVGMGATVLNGARVGAWSLVAAGALVREGFEVPEGSLVAGVPARVVRPLAEQERHKIELNATAYLHLASLHRAAGLT